ncbi:hypothetical protein NM208_g1718 [Fusarium decemcellulare]|uniref:Uncharacterized protein n=1 Tax=Fusarium decemcellulare TaxID=57161 RepID=A0ACC1SV69_9HYPO|nr:hypothetical protein NM208_g1718 [Fusarium decemcellulare]
MRQHDQCQNKIGLGVLAVELKELICLALREPNPDGTQTSDGQKALLSLCATSRVFRQVAQPLAYYSITHERINLVRLVQTLRWRPDLAASVKQFYQPIAGIYNVSSEELVFLRSVVDQLRLCSPSQDISRFGRKPEQVVSLEDVCVELIIALSPNLQTLKLYSLEKGMNQQNQYPILYAQFRRASDPNDKSELPCLHHLELGRTRTDDMPFTRPSIDTALMFKATPNLRQLFLRGITNLHDSTFGQEEFGSLHPTLIYLHSMELQECALETRRWGEIFLGQLIDMAPNLEHFRYASEHYRYPDPVAKHLSVPHMLRAIRTQHVTINLKSMEICLSAFARCKWPNRGNLIQVVDLERFSKLETLKLDENAICRYYDSPLNADMSVPTTTCLTEILPRQLKTFVIRVFKGSESHIWGDLAHLASNSFLFPRLEFIGVQAIFKSENENHWMKFEKKVLEQGLLLKDQFATSRIRVEVEVFKHKLPERENGVLGIV